MRKQMPRGFIGIIAKKKGAGDTFLSLSEDKPQLAEQRLNAAGPAFYSTETDVFAFGDNKYLDLGLL